MGTGLGMMGIQLGSDAGIFVSHCTVAIQDIRMAEVNSRYHKASSMRVNDGQSRQDMLTRPILPSPPSSGSRQTDGFHSGEAIPAAAYVGGNKPMIMDQGSKMLREYVCPRRRTRLFLVCRRCVEMKVLLATAGNK